MKRIAFICAALLATGACVAEDDRTPPPPPPPVAKPPLFKANILPVEAHSDDQGTPGVAPAVYSSEARWEIAGYNNNEIVYTIFITSHDSRILRCSTELKGAYIENGEKVAVADRQISTVFPERPVQVGNWMGMDEESGATYSVTCHPV
jgi:hypothetical protein